MSTSSPISRVADALRMQKEIRPLVAEICANSNRLKSIFRSSSLIESTAEEIALFARHGYADSLGRLTPKGFVMIGKTSANYDKLIGRLIRDTYHIKEIIGEGRWAVVYGAEHCYLPSKLAIKVLVDYGDARPSPAILREIFELDNRTFVLPTDIFPYAIPVNEEISVPAYAIVYPWIEGKTIKEFCKTDAPLSSNIVREYLHQVGVALAALHSIGIAHGDLTENNILIRETGTTYEFQIIDLINPIEEGGLEGAKREDYENFKKNLLRILALIPQPRMSMQKHLGSSLLCIVKAAFSGELSNFAELVGALKDNHLHEKYLSKRDEFIDQKFKSKPDIMLLRYEEFRDVSVAREVFCPFDKIFDPLRQFGSAIINGHRGSGKSSYLGALAFQPDSKINIVDPTRHFGILFSCRQGEFKRFRTLRDAPSKESAAELKNVLITKIIRRTVSILRKAYSRTSLERGINLELFKEFFRNNFPKSVTVDFRRSSYETLSDLEESLVRHETLLIDEAINRASIEDSPQYCISRKLDEGVLITFFKAVRAAIPPFSEARFMILFDDAGEPNVPPIVQRVINEILRSTNHIYCVKLSTERFAYTLNDSDGKAIESPHDYDKFDLGEYLLIKDSEQHLRSELRKYFEEMLRVRLRSYRSQNIVDYLGNEDRKEETSRLLVPLALGERRQALYYGWNTVWQVADRTPRQLIEIVHNMFSKANIGEDTPPAVIAPKLQSMVITNYSESKLRSLRSLTGNLQIRGKPVPLGLHLENFVIGFGKYSETALRVKSVRCRERTKQSKPASIRFKRFHECLAIEIDKQLELDNDSERVLAALLRYAVLDDSRVATSFDDGYRRRIYILNRVFCPALGISYRRSDHWRIGGSRFSRLLKLPHESFMTEVKKLNERAEREEGQDLFE